MWQKKAWKISKITRKETFDESDDYEEDWGKGLKEELEKEEEKNVLEGCQFFKNVKKNQRKPKIKNLVKLENAKSICDMLCKN